MNTRLTVYYRKSGEAYTEPSEVFNFGDAVYDVSVGEGVLIINTREFTYTYAPGVWTRTELVKMD